MSSLDPARAHGSSAGRIVTGAAIIAGGVLLAYANTLHAPFVFDDLFSVRDNPTIQHLARSWHPPEDNGSITVAGRPLLNFSLALNYAVSGLDPWSYHALNLVIHVLAALTLFGLVRRTLLRPVLAPKFGAAAGSLAWLVAWLWALHPLQTEAVTYVIQRAESLMGLFFLLTLYGFVRSVETERGGKWQAVAVGSCLLGVATKELTALAPIVVFLYDRTFVSGSFREAWRRHRWRHLSLLATWLPLFWLLLSTGGDRGGSFQLTDGRVWVGHALTQFEAVTRYLGLSLWPHPLVFDYGLIVPPSLGVALVWALPVLALLAGTIVALGRWPVGGFLGACFFLILAPTSALPATLQIIVEHRMYLPLAALLSLLVTGAYLWLGRRVIVAGLLLGIGAGWLTAERNVVYRDEISLWSDTLLKRPNNARAYDTLGSLWLDRGNLSEAERCFSAALKLQPDYTLACYNLGVVFQRTGRDRQALEQFLEAIRLEPKFTGAHVNAGIALLKLGRASDAAAHFTTALELQPDSADLHHDLGLALEQLGRFDDAIQQYQTALHLEPQLAAADRQLAALSLRRGDMRTAEQAYRDAIRSEPAQAETHFDLGNLLASQSRFPEAIDEYRRFLQAKPGSLPARANLGNALLAAGRTDDAIAEYELILRQRPGDRGIEENLRQARALKQARP
ncbi:MAG TPA: tetratricopeptide repeat protein [Opitutaceae bacterium]|nr:tetratricopeptide repeat protein [Opitutaceae bacterium]